MQIMPEITITIKVIGIIPQKEVSAEGVLNPLIPMNVVWVQCTKWMKDTHRLKKTSVTIGLFVQLLTQLMTMMKCLIVTSLTTVMLA